MACTNTWWFVRSDVFARADAIALEKAVGNAQGRMTRAKRRAPRAMSRLLSARRLKSTNVSSRSNKSVVGGRAATSWADEVINRTRPRADAAVRVDLHGPGRRQAPRSRCAAAAHRGR